MTDDYTLPVTDETLELAADVQDWMAGAIEDEAEQSNYADEQIEAALLEDTQDMPEVAAADWSVLDDERVAAALEAASRKIGANYGHVTSADDQHQEGSVHLALNADTVREYLADDLLGERALHRWLYVKLQKGVRTDAARSDRHVEIGTLRDLEADDGVAYSE